MARRKMPARPGMVAPDARKVAALIGEKGEPLMLMTADPDNRFYREPGTDLEARVAALEARIDAIERFLVFP